MTVAELIEALEEFPMDAEVRIAKQPGWPITSTIHRAISAHGVIYVAEGEQLGYLDGDAAEELGWG